MLLRARSSALSEIGARNSGGEVGAEYPTTDEAGSKGLEAEVAPASKDANGLFRTGGVDAGSGASVGVLDAENKISLMSGSANGASISHCPVLSKG